MVLHPTADAATAATWEALRDDLAEVRVARPGTRRGMLRWLQGNPWTWPGPSNDDERVAAAEATVAWASAEGLDLDAPLEAESVNRWRSYERPGGPA